MRPFFFWARLAHASLDRADAENPRLTLGGSNRIPEVSSRSPTIRASAILPLDRRIPRIMSIKMHS